MISICTGPECSRQSVAKGLCNAHYQQHNKGQKLRPVKRYKKTGTIAYCPIPGCEREQHSRGLCTRHASTCNRHHLNPKDYFDLYVQGCHNPGCDETANLEVDHDHSCCEGGNSCGKCIRGVLCRGCNMLAYSVDNGKGCKKYMDGILRYLAAERPSLSQWERLYK